MQRKVKIIDTTLRDGSHAVHHQYTAEHVSNICRGLEAGGVYAAEVGHGGGIGGSVLLMGLGKTSDRDLLEAARKELKNTKLGIMLIPGLGTKDDLLMASEIGVDLVRVTVHCTEADVGMQHVQLAKQLGMEVIMFFMMSHMISPEELAEQAKLAESYGADVIYFADSSGAMVPDEIEARVKAIKEAVKLPVGVHTHNNLGLAVANSLKGIQAGADYVDGTLQGLGAGCGNTPTEAISAVLHKMNIETGTDFYALMEAGANYVRPLIQHPIEVSNESIILGYNGIYSSFFLHTMEVANRYNVNPRLVFEELGRRKVVGGQEDQILEIVLSLTEK